jgi:hypothetical protein
MSDRKIRDTDTLEGLLGFLWTEIPGTTPHIFVSDSWTVLKDRCLELGAHRENGVEGTGRDLREVIQPITREIAQAISDLGGAEDLRTHTSLGYDDGIEVGERAAIETVYWLRYESVSLNGFIDQSLDRLAERGFASKYGYSDDYCDGLYRGIVNVVEKSESRIAALDLALALASAENDKPAEERWAIGWLSQALAEHYEGREQLARILGADRHRTRQELSEKASREWRQGSGIEELEIEETTLPEPGEPYDRWIGGEPDDAIGEEPALVEEGTNKSVPNELKTGTVVLEAEALKPSRVQQLLEDVWTLSADLASDYPATGQEVGHAINRVADRGDVVRLEELRDILRAEARTGDIEDLDAFLEDEQLRESREEAQAELTDSAKNLCYRAGVDASRRDVS